ncbi:hypothetical protein [Methylobacterium soli]|uniref:Uncharacterized protein n=1 Tax=Methylobacterium soli TaxID=553447 RepID=A0A6L3SS68_9HYPH|nr:hypothetical protein [Methylobacterium soli]KAB1072893.1 hypothetical protein F6X53_27740 [Methylobacterium soli]
MRSVVAVLGLLWAATSAAEAKTQPKPATVSTQSGQPESIQQQIERKSERALKEAQEQEARFDAAVRKATNSICSGCGGIAEPSLSRDRAGRLAGRAGSE